MKNYLVFDNITAYGSVKECQRTKLSTGEKALKITTKEGAWIEFTGENGNLGGVDFTSDKILVVPVYFKETHSVYFKLEFYEDAEAKEHADMAMGVLPGFVVNIELALSSLDLNSLFLRRTPGRLKNTSTGIPVKAEKLQKFIFRIPASNNPHTIYVGQPYISDIRPEHKIPSVPFIDKLGQWKMKEWAGKTKDFAELKENYTKWTEENLTPMFRTANRSVYGGDMSENLGSTGYFRTYCDKNGVWYLIDPDGYKFYSIGVDCVNTGMSGPVEGIEGLFEELPSPDGEYKEAWGRRRDFCFNAKNLISVYGADWVSAWEELTAKRLKHWGFNTIANWSMRGFGQRNGIPYVIETPFPRTEKNIFRDFPDVFAPEYAKNAAECAEFLQTYRDDKFLIGYFLRNEPNWAFGDYNIAHMMITSGEETYSRREFINFLQNRYVDIASLNASWGLNLTSFENFMQPFTSKLNEQSQRDTREFTKKLIHRYVETPSLACRKVDTNHMNLGLRWAWIASDDFYEGAEYMDVFSINCYAIVPNAEEIANISKKSGKPVMIGEFHAGALDVGLPANALQGVANQSERGYFYSYYMENGALIPELVGCHYFQYNDQAATGRFDGENLNIGLVDVCGKPYYDMIEKVIETNRYIYDIRAGKKTPTERKAVGAIREGF